MICDNINNLYRYALPAALQKALDYLKSTDWDTMKPGKWDVDAELIRCSLTAKTITEPCLVWESHRKYADVHYIIKGCEIHHTAPVEMLIPKTEYDPATDCQLYEPHSGDGNTFELRCGDFLIEYPGEAHNPNSIKHSEGTELIKVVMKVKI